jgi:isoleucyl-tRNA synthetase
VRAEGRVGASLQAEVTVTAQAEDLALLQSLEDDLKFVFITSAARAVAGDGDLGVEVHATTHEKCGRCWHHRADVGRDPAHPELCGRCVDNLYGDGEVRVHA